ncbi:MAG TPA: 4-hydroxy-3-methylbut-2-enyl diphosphate reductase [Bacteroidales bacterium]|nr:4-hydroxy-3-methylbut-2-enyl diphosphate reductase [Bacteroidales bacterium]HPS17388.1 4-hydroxy-3-methylbut-2-enyl diphosphate reductase [Bacteroidales bacterium]
MKVHVDPNSGFCFGVVFAIMMAEEELEKSGLLYCLGDIVHNNREVERLASKGLIIINHDELKNIKNSKVLIRAHGEPPETYKIALENNLELLDASCPVVLKLQNRIRIGAEEMQKKNGQIVIYGKEGHAEVNGLVGQISGNAIIVNNESDLDKIDYSKPVRFYSQTTQPTEGFKEMIDGITERFKKSGNLQPDFIPYNTICSQVSHKEPRLKKFAKEHDVVIFVSGRKSSNGLFLYNLCLSINPKTYFISEKSELKKEWFENAESAGVCGATSTPMWLMEEVAEEINKMK